MLWNRTRTSTGPFESRWRGRQIGSENVGQINALLHEHRWQSQGSDRLTDALVEILSRSEKRQFP
jgi:hypothetical protein